MGKKRRFREITESQGCWIKFKMALKGITQYDIAIQADCSPQMVSQVLRGRKNSDRVKAAIIYILGGECLESFSKRGGAA
jgi:transcriptional regulator with XRE-family HTH domain